MSGLAKAKNFLVTASKRGAAGAEGGVFSLQPAILGVEFPKAGSHLGMVPQARIQPQYLQQKARHVTNNLMTVGSGLLM
jgi:hypothetical protein